MSLLPRLAVSVVLGAGPAMIAMQEIPGDLEGMVVYLGFDGSDVDDLLEGEVIQLDEDLKEGSEKEMAVSVAVILPTTLDKAVEIIRSGRSFEIDPTIIEYGRLGVPPSEADFARLGYTGQELEEVEKLLEVETASEFNFSTREIRRFQRLARRLEGRNPRKDPTVRRAINAQLRTLLLERYRAYREGGLEAIAPYDRGDGERASPGKELTQALREDLAQDARLAPLVRELQQALIRYPEAVFEGIESDFFWAKANVRDRPCFILIHRMSQFDPDGALIAERQFYVGHNYNSLHLVMGVLPTERGILLFYRNRTSSDQVAGRVGAAKKPLGRRRMRKAIVEFLEEIRRQFDNDG